MNNTRLSITCYPLDLDSDYVADKTKTITLDLSVHLVDENERTQGLVSSSHVFIDEAEALDLIERLQRAINKAHNLRVIANA
jgi:hypothetical protein